MKTTCLKMDIQVVLGTYVLEIWEVDLGSGPGGNSFDCNPLWISFLFLPSL